MCATCGCDSDVKVSIHRVSAAGILNAENVSFTPLKDPISTISEKRARKEITLEQDVLLKNNLLAERNRGYFLAKEILALNLVSSPGSGKTSLLERTLKDLKNEESFFVIEGDQQTSNDADRIASTGAPVVQINTGRGCHLDSEMISNAIKQLNPKDKSILFIENIGNLVCPAMFDLGEQKRVVIISVTEGEDKPIKYPDMFQTSQLCIINKIDLLPYLKFDVEVLKKYGRKVNPQMEFIELSCTSGAGLSQWYDWLKKEKLQEHALLV
jgi:hydrogenase nickel incorporation protein HypB